MRIAESLLARDGAYRQARFACAEALREHRLRCSNEHGGWIGAMSAQSRTGRRTEMLELGGTL